MEGRGCHVHGPHAWAVISGVQYVLFWTSSCLVVFLCVDGASGLAVGLINVALLRSQAQSCRMS